MGISNPETVHTEVSEMYLSKTFLAVIPARGGSKGIPRKNIVEVHGKPLIAYTIEPALKSAYIDRVIVSTDDEEIATISKMYGADVPFIRPSHLATDEAKTIDVVLHAIQIIDESYDYVVILQPTQPMRTVEQIDEAIEQVVMQCQESLVSVELATQHPIMYRMLKEDGAMVPLLQQSSTVRRQDFQPYYYVNGLIYINEVKSLTPNTSLNDNRYGFVTEATVDIDTPQDLTKFTNQVIMNGI
jgi:CMP-N,N'-diacetyllegionaminic acid synthase